MKLGSDVQIRDGLLAEKTPLSEKPRLGFGRTETTVHRASIRLNYLNGNRVSSTVVFEGRPVSLMAQQQSGDQAPDNTLLAQNNTPPPPGRTPAQGGTPDSTVEIPDGKGGKTVRKFGPDGKAETDIDHGHDHGAGDPHAHDWDWGKKPPRQPGRPLTPEEQKNVKRAAGGVTAGVIIYWIISEGSRLFPPRNLIPIP